MRQFGSLAMFRDAHALLIHTDRRGGGGGSKHSWIALKTPVFSYIE